MSVISGVLVKTLEDLKINDFKRFKHNLWSRGPITRQRLEEASIDDTVAMMVQAYCEMNCGSVMSDILRSMHHNQLALNLEKDLQLGGVRLGSPSSSGGAEGASCSQEDSAHCSSSLRSFSFDTQRPDTGAELRIVMVGKTGAGKSASANTILGDNNLFHTEFSAGSVTATCKRETGTVSGRLVAVVDTPGLFDTMMATMKREIGKCVEMSVPGPHAFLLVIRLGTFIEKERNAVKWIQETFGPGASRYAIVIFTGGDQLKKPVEDYLACSDDLKDVVQSCQNRYHVINNEDKIDRTQVTELLKKIDAMVMDNGGTYYTNAMYQEAQRRRREEEKMLRQADEMQTQEERERGERRSRILKKIKKENILKKYLSFLKEIGTFVEVRAQAREVGLEEELCAAGLGNAFDFMEYVGDDYNNDIDKLTEQLSKLE